MGNFEITTLLIVIGITSLVIFGTLVLIAKFYRMVDQGRVLIVNTMRSEPIVSFTGRVVIPVIHRSEVMDISVKTVEIDRRGKEGLICRDNIRADIKVTFFVRVNKTAEDVLKVAQAIGCARASDPNTLEELFAAKFSEALKTVGKRLEFEELYTKRDDFRDQIIDVIGKDLNGYVLDDCAIDFLEQTPLEALDPQNILDAQGIRKITEITAGQNVRTNELKQEERKAIKKQDVEALEAIMALDRQQADAHSRQQREIASVRAREEAETLRIQAEEKKKAELARLKQEEEVAVQEQAKFRQVEVAQKNRERAVAVEGERVEKDRMLEAISREREVEIQRIEKEKAIEQEKKSIAEVIASRIAVEKSVADEQERIKDIHVLADSRRRKEALIISAEASAQEKVVLQIKEAEALEQASKLQAKQKVTLAAAELEASDHQARAKIRLAEAVQAEVAATGLAEARVKEANAVATEKLGSAEAKVRFESLQAEAKGLMEKTAALRSLEGTAREHEEFRLQIDKRTEVALAQIAANRAIAKEQAEVLSHALSNAKINLVGGDGRFLETFFKAVSLGQAADVVMDQSQAGRLLFGDYVEGRASLREDVKELVETGAANSEALKNVSLAAFISQLAAKLDGSDRERLVALAGQKQTPGVD